MKTPAIRTLVFMMASGMLYIAACTGTIPEAPTTAAITQEVVELNPTAQQRPTLPSRAAVLAFRNGLVVTATGADPIPIGAVVIENGLITAVGPESDITLPEGAIIVDLGGRTILPGLIDARASAILKTLQMTNGQIEVAFFLKRALTTGVTTLRATGWTWEAMQDSPDLQAALQAVGNTIPTVVMAGASLAHREGPTFTRYYPDQTVGVGTVEEARQKTEELIELGADQVSFMMSSGPSLRESLEERLPVLTLEMLRTIVETAHARDTLVVGQALFPEEALVAIKAGVDELTAWPSLTQPLPDDLLEAIVSQSIPVVSGFSVGMPQEGDVRRFLDAGGTLVFGTFAPNSNAKPDHEFEMMLLNRMTPMEMIQSATRNAAHAVGLGDEVGTLEVGKQADIIVVDGNPFEDDFVSVFRKVIYVVNNGEIVIQPDR